MAAEAEIEPDSRRWLALIICCSALFMTLLDVSVTNVALPSIGRATGASPSQLQWVVSGYTLAFGLVPVLAGRLGDDHGRRLMFQVGVGSFAATSMLAGLAPTAEVLIGARVLQGLAGGLINPQVSGLVQQMFRSNERGTGLRRAGDDSRGGHGARSARRRRSDRTRRPTFGWRLVFFVNIPVGVAVIDAGSTAVAHGRTAGPAPPRYRRSGAAGRSDVLRPLRRGSVRQRAGRAAGAAHNPGR